MSFLLLTALSGVGVLHGADSSNTTVAAEADEAPAPPPFTTILGPTTTTGPTSTTAAPSTTVALPTSTAAPTTTLSSPATTLPAPTTSAIAPTTTVKPSALAKVNLALEEIAVVNVPSDLASRKGSSLLYVTERWGTVRTVDPVSGEVSLPLVDLTDDLATDGERGLLGIAFSLDGSQMYLSFNPADGNSRIDEFTMNGDDVDVTTRRTVITVEQPPTSNHKGGDVAIGPDGMLYWGLGDGGGQGDPFGNGQNLDTLLGGMVRIDPSGRAAGGYSVPRRNPWPNSAAPEKWISGLRNPWRFSFDRTTGDLWIADVGQSLWEEINFLRAPSRGAGANLGWPLREGRHEYLGPAPVGAVSPIFEYAHSKTNGCSITGGYVYRGKALPDLRGTYLYSDFCVSTLRGIRRTVTGVDSTDFGATIRGGGIATFGEGPDGEIYALSLRSGAIARVVRG